MAELEATRLRIERINDGGIAARSRHNDERERLRQRLHEWLRLHDRSTIKLEGRMAVDRIGAEGGHAVVTLRRITVAAQVVGALHELQLAMLDCAGVLV